MNRNTKIAAGAGAALIAAGAVMYGLHQNSKPAPESDGKEKSINVEIVHQNQEKKTIELKTDEAYLGDALEKAGLIAGEEGQYGLYVTTVDGESADFDQDGSWWKLEENGQQAQTGADSLPVEEGATYTWIYTIGQ